MRFEKGTQMNTFPLGPAGQIPEGTMRGYTANHAKVLVAHVEGRFYAMDARCPHMRADLSRGTLRGFIVTCPLHGSQFDVRDGSVVAWVEKLPGVLKSAASMLKKPQPANTYPIQINNGDLHIVIPEQNG